MVQFNTVRRRPRRLVAVVTAASLVLGQLPLGTLAQAQQMSRQDYEACQSGSEQGFRTAIEDLTFRALNKGTQAIDYKRVIGEEWRRVGLDQTIDAQVDIAITQVREESSWAKLWSTLASKEKAQELAETAARRVYESDAMKKAIEDLAVGVGKTVGNEIEAVTLATAEPASQCMQAYLGPRYGKTIARVVGRDAGKEYAVDASKGGAHVDSGQVLKGSSGGIAGAVVLVVRRQLANLASRIGQRLVGAALSRLVSVVAGGVGLVLIAKDIWDFRHGVLPIIATEMKSKDTKAKVQDELAKVVSEQIGENLREISTKTADRVLEIWQDFRRAHAKVVELAERNEDFRKFVDSLGPDAVPRLDEVVGIVLAAEGEAGVLKRLGDGTLDLAVNRLPPPALDIARETRSLETAFKWSALAGDRLAEVASFELHQRAKPESFTRASLERLLALADRTAIMRLAALEGGARAALFELGSGDLKALARALTEGELDSLARYQTGLEKSAALRILNAVAQTPSRMQQLGRPRVRDAILASRDQQAAVAMVLRADEMVLSQAVVEDFQRAFDGQISPILIWEKHSAGVVIAALLALVVLAFLKRLILPRRPRVIVQQVAASGRQRQA